MLLGLRDVVNSKILELIVQCGSMNPIWSSKPKFPDEHIAEAWLDFKIGKAQECVDKINTSEKNKQISVLLKEIFYGGDLTRLEFYTVARGDIYRKKDLSDFAYAEGLNYLSVFLSEYVEKDFNELFDILLIRGQWTNNSSSKEVSEAFHQLLEIPAAVSRLDESLSDDGVDGSRLKAAFIRVDRDPSQGRYINSIIETVNETALEILESSAGQLAVIDKHLKNLVDDVQKKHPELIINWKELNSVAKSPLLQQMAEDHRRINCFVQLLHLCIR
jgi:DNA-binding phage protein